MPIPNADSAYIPTDKLTDYLLNLQHPVGGAKPSWFRGLGYENANSARLRQYSTIMTPGGKQVNVTTVWIVESGEHFARLVTAYPGAKR